MVERGAGEVSVGVHLAKTCDRHKQAEQFVGFVREHMSAHPGRPQIYVVHGDETGRPRSLVERLYHEKIRFWPKPDGDQSAVPHKIDINWPRGWDPEEGEQKLREALFEKYDPSFPNTRDISAQAFHNLPYLGIPLTHLTPHIVGPGPQMIGLTGPTTHNMWR